MKKTKELKREDVVDNLKDLIILQRKYNILDKTLADFDVELLQNASTINELEVALQAILETYHFFEDISNGNEDCDFENDDRHYHYASLGCLSEFLADTLPLKLAYNLENNLEVDYDFLPQDLDNCFVYAIDKEDIRFVSYCQRKFCFRNLPYEDFKKEFEITEPFIIFSDTKCLVCRKETEKNTRIQTPGNHYLCTDCWKK